MSDQFVSVDKLTVAADPITSCTRILNDRFSSIAECSDLS
jgi:hypothetical protein